MKPGERPRASRSSAPMARRLDLTRYFLASEVVRRIPLQARHRGELRQVAEIPDDRCRGPMHRPFVSSARCAVSPADRLITVLIQKSALSRFGRTLQAPRTRSVAGWSPGKMIHAHLTPQSTQLLSGPFRASVLRPQLPSNSQRMCLLLALRFARPSRVPAPRRQC
jgi:hypothetical protein